METDGTIFLCSADSQKMADAMVDRFLEKLGSLAHCELQTDQRDTGEGIWYYLEVAFLSSNPKSVQEALWVAQIVKGFDHE